MRVTVLGGSAASPNTGMGCAGFLVEESGTQLVLDLGPGTLPELRRHADFRALDGVIISHMHIDHVLDLLALRHALAYNPVRPLRPTPVWLPPGGMALLAAATAPFDACDAPGTFAATLDLAEYDPAEPLSIGSMTVTFAPAVHYLPAWAIRVHGPTGDLGYTGDTGPTANLAPFFSGVKVLIAEATLREARPNAGATRGSLTAVEAGELARDAQAGSLLLTHIWEEHGFAAQEAAAASVFAGEIAVARPGLVMG